MPKFFLPIVLGVALLVVLLDSFLYIRTSRDKVFAVFVLLFVLLGVTIGILWITFF